MFTVTYAVEIKNPGHCGKRISSLVPLVTAGSIT